VCVGTGRQKCFVCKVVDSESTVSCSEKSCHQLYHVNCVRSLLPDTEVAREQTFICPLHHCATCQVLGKTVFAGLKHTCPQYFGVSLYTGCPVKNWTVFEELIFCNFFRNCCNKNRM